MKNLSSPISQKPSASRMAMVKMRALAIMVFFQYHRRLPLVAAPRILQSCLGPSRTRVLRFVEKYFFDGLAKNASNLESESETGIVFPGLDGNDGGAGDTNALGEFCLRPFVLSS